MINFISIKIKNIFKNLKYNVDNIDKFRHYKKK